MVFEPDLIARGLGATDAELGITQTTRFRIFIRGENFERLALLTEWTHLELSLKRNAIGTWVLETASDANGIELLTKKGGIIVTREVNGVERTIFSGFVWTEWGYTENTFRASGYSDEALLANPARPTPSLADPPFNDAYDVRTGIASTIMMNLVDVNFGPSAPAKWRIPQLVLAPDPLLGSVITSRTNLDPLITLLAELSVTPYSGGLGFYLRQSDTVPNSIEFNVYAPENKTDTAKFSIGLQTALDYEDFAYAPEANHVYVLGGDDFGISRTIVAVQDDDNIAEWGRIISTIVDKRGTTNLSELYQNAAESIAGALTTTKKTIIPFDNPSLQFGEDYDLSTLVSINTRSGVTTGLITQVDIVLDAETSYKITPIIGTGSNPGEEQIATLIRTISDRVSNIERNWNIPDDSLIPAMFHPSIRDNVGDLKLTARPSAQLGWMICDGSAINRSLYDVLFFSIGTLYGAGDGVTTFNIPDFRGRMPVGAGGFYGVGELGGSDTTNINFGTHHHTHSHGGGNLVYNHVHLERAHTHPGSHLHDLQEHYHYYPHTHLVDFSSASIGKRNNDSVDAFGFDEPNLSSGTEDHHHNISGSDVSDGPVGSSTDAGTGAEVGAFTKTKSDNTVHDASYTGTSNGPSSTSWTGGTDPDSADAALSVTGLDIKNTFQCVNVMIFVGVEV